MMAIQLFQIGEVAGMFRVSVSTLRYYEKYGLLRPEYTDPDTGYRYYGPRQLEVLTTIRFLRELDMPLPQIRDFLSSREIDKMLSMLNSQEKEVQRRQSELAAIEKKIHLQKTRILDALASKIGEIEVRKIPERNVIWIRKQISPRFYFDLEPSIRQLEQQQPDISVTLGKVGIGISLENLEKGSFSEYEKVFFLLDESEKYRGEAEKWPEENYLCVRFCGSHKDAPQYYEKLVNYAKQQDWKLNGFSREITMIDEGMTTNPDSFVTEIQIPVKREKCS